METKKFIYYQEDDMLIGWLEEFPDYRTQGETLDELKENLQDIYAELSSGRIPKVFHVGELLRRLKRKDLIRMLEDLGCILIRHGGRHDWYQNQKTKISNRFPLPRDQRFVGETYPENANQNGLELPFPSSRPPCLRVSVFATSVPPVLFFFPHLCFNIPADTR